LCGPGPTSDPGSLVELNPQPFPPAPGSSVALNPQPFPPAPGEWVGLNPQPYPPSPYAPDAVAATPGVQLMSYSGNSPGNYAGNGAGNYGVNFSGNYTGNDTGNYTGNHPGNCGPNHRGIGVDVDLPIIRYMGSGMDVPMPVFDPLGEVPTPIHWSKLSDQGPGESIKFVYGTLQVEYKNQESSSSGGGTSSDFPSHVIITSRQNHGIGVLPYPISPCLWCPQ